MAIARRLLVIATVAATLVGISGVANAAPTSTTVRLTTSEAALQSPTNPLTVLQAAGGAVIVTPNGEHLGRLRGTYHVDLGGLQCFFVERSDSITIRFSAGDTLQIRAAGSDVSTDGCAGRHFHRVLSWRVTGGTGRYAGVIGNGTAVGSLTSDPAQDYATSTLTWHGTLIGLSSTATTRS